jgi:hypothetical protein
LHGSLQLLPDVMLTTSAKPLERLDRQLTDGLFADQDLFGPTSARLSRSALRLRHAGPLAYKETRDNATGFQGSKWARP